MPLIETKVNISLEDSKKEAIQRRFGQAITILGKSESWLMLSFEQCTMYFKGKNDMPMAFCNVQLFGKASETAYEKMTAEITTILSEELEIATDQIYVKYEEVSHWGWNGSNF